MEVKVHISTRYHCRMWRLWNFPRLQTTDNIRLNPGVILAERSFSENYLFWKKGIMENLTCLDPDLVELIFISTRRCSQQQWDTQRSSVLLQHYVSTLCASRLRSVFPSNWLLLFSSISILFISLRSSLEENEVARWRHDGWARLHNGIFVDEWGWSFTLLTEDEISQGWNSKHRMYVSTIINDCSCATNSHRKKQDDTCSDHRSFRIAGRGNNIRQDRTNQIKLWFQYHRGTNCSSEKYSFS